MQLVRRQDMWTPFREMEELTSRLGRLFGTTALAGDGERELLATTDWSPSCNIQETDKSYEIRAELPGVKKGDVHVTLEDGVLTLQGERRDKREEKGVRYHRREVAYGHFLRRFTMPDDADETKVDASFEDGMLLVAIGKTPSKVVKAKQIKIH